MAPPITAAIAGAQKSGTTSLLRYLAQHPQLSGQAPVEIGYFYDQAEWAAGWDRAYARYFYAADTDLLIAKSAMLYARRICVERLASHNPACTVILILRDPVERAFSSYRMERNNDWIDQPFDHILDVLDDRSHRWNKLFIQFGEYAAALRQLYEFFPPEHVIVLIYEEFTSRPVDGCRQVFRQLGVDPAFAPHTAIAHNVHREPSSPAVAATVRWLRRRDNHLKLLAKRALPPRAFDRIGTRITDAARGDRREEQMSARVREGLGRYYAAHNGELESLLGRDLSHWGGM